MALSYPQPQAASYCIVRSKQIDSFPIFKPHISTHIRDWDHLRLQQHARDEKEMVAGNQQNEDYRGSMMGSPIEGYTYNVFDHGGPSNGNSPSPTNSALIEERSIERWESRKSLRRKENPTSLSSLHGNIRPVQKIGDIRTVYSRSTPSLDKVSAPPPGTKKKTLDASVYEKEEEVNSLTNLLVTRMNTELDPNSYGLCTKCNKSVHFDDEGCTALDQLYHARCFCCNKCARTLKGVSFYTLEAKAVCEACYMETLEKCASCRKPIQERILRATGKPYHPKCFTCVACKQCLDGIPFTVDANNNIHCIKDFHAKFAPRCSVCKEPIIPEPGQEETIRIVCMDRNFHPKCYRCEDCLLVLSSESEGHGCYPLDGHVLCHACNIRRVESLS